MATMNDIVLRALKRTGVVPLGEAPENAEVSDALDALNDMIFSWENDGIDIGHTTKVLGDTFPFDDKHIQGVAALLAVRISDDNGTDISAPLARDARNGWIALQAQYVIAPEDVEIDRGLRVTPGQSVFMTDIINDT